jgi:hypothetical protein
MSKTETLRQSAAASNERRLEYLANQTELLRVAKLHSAEKLAETLEPLAQAMAALTDETRQTLAEIDRKSWEHSEQFSRQINAAVQHWKDAAAAAQQAADSLNQAGQRMAWRHYALAALTGALTAALVSVFWLWLKPPIIQNMLDSQAVAEHLRPVLTGRRLLSRGK